MSEAQGEAYIWTCHPAYDVSRCDSSHGVAQVFINPDECIDCGSCADLCAQNAIFPESDLPAAKAEFAAKNRAFFN